MLFYALFLCRCKIIEKDPEHIGVAGNILCGFPANPAVYQGLLVFVPIQLKDFGFQLSGQFFINSGSFGIFRHICTKCHGLQAPAKQQLLKTHLSVLTQLICPVYKNPVARHPLQ
ncbi:hypothetical protein D3C86_1804800 [compost metagenome]